MVTSKLVLLLAISFIGEAGWHSESDWAAIAHVYKKRSEFYGVPMEHMVKRYSRVLHEDNEVPRAVMLRSLRLDGKQPEFWSLSLRWSNYKPRWEAALAFAQRFLDGDVPDPCPTAFHFGGPRDEVGPERALSRVQCTEPVANLYYTQRLRPYRPAVGR